MRWRGRRCILVVLLPLLACTDPDTPGCLRSTGDVRRETRPLPRFYQLELHDDVDVVLTDDTTSGVVVEAGRGLLPHVVTEVREGVLTVRNRNRCNWVRDYRVPITVYLPSRYLRHLFHYGWGQVTTAAPWRADYHGLLNYGAGTLDLHVDARQFVRLDLNGLGSVRLRGTAPRGEFIVQNVGELHAFGLDLRSCRPISQGPARAEVAGRDTLHVTLDGSGDVFYDGRPPFLRADGRGSGRLLRR